MKKIKKILITVISILLVAVGFLYFRLSPIFLQKLKHFKSESQFTLEREQPDPAKKTILIVAENEGTELFDLMAPFYLFNATLQANVFIVSEKREPILLVNSLFILPHYTFAEINSRHISPDVIVIPNLNVHLETPPKKTTVNWIKENVSTKTIVLSICDGSATAAATGLYNGKLLTTHATDFKTLQRQFPKPVWVKNISATESGNLYSTAGVSNAVEGSLTVIKRLFGEEVMQTVLQQIRYPHATIQIAHKSDVVGRSAMFRIATKVIFQKNCQVGVLLKDGVDEFTLASLLDTYTRTFPASLDTYSSGNKEITSRYGLILYPTDDITHEKVNELHLVSPVKNVSTIPKIFPNASIITYDTLSKKYPIDICLERIEHLYGTKFKNCVKLTLDYN